MLGAKDLSRRGVLKGAAGLTTASLFGGLYAQESAAAETIVGPLGFHNAPASGIDNIALKNLFGKVPDGLQGTLFRNGPGQFSWGEERIGHWFDGDGFLRAFRFDENAVTLTGRFADTQKRRRDRSAGGFETFGFGTIGNPDAGLRNADDANAANTSVLMVGDDLWALWEAGSPFAVEPGSLASRGIKTISPDLAHMPFSAHPKRSVDGSIWNFGAAFGYSKLFLWHLAPNGEVLRAELIDLPRACYLHDWAMTETKLILPLQPWIASPGSTPQVSRLSWQPDLGMQVLVIDKDDFSQRKIFDAPSKFFFHTGDAFEERDGTIRFDACISDEPTLDANAGGRILEGKRASRSEPVTALLTLHPNGQSSIDATRFQGEFPRIDPRLVGQKDRKLFFVTGGATLPDSSHRYNAVMSYDWKAQTEDLYDFGPNVLLEEHVFAPDPSHQSRGWLIGTGINVEKQASEIYVFDAGSISSGPIAAWQAHSALPIGFHGVWSPARA
ncbi:MAG: carotenoid oxygenase family protein [Pseudomonadota bacterium]